MAGPAVQEDRGLEIPKAAAVGGRALDDAPVHVGRGNPVAAAGAAERDTRDRERDLMRLDLDDPVALGIADIVGTRTERGIRAHREIGARRDAADRRFTTPGE